MFTRHGRPLEFATGSCNRQGQPLRVSYVFEEKNGRAEKMGHSQLEHKGPFKVEISHTRPLP